MLQVVYPKYREALKLAVQAFREPVQHPSADKSLPHIFGSPEYLQASTICQDPSNGKSQSHTLSNHTYFDDDRDYANAVWQCLKSREC